MLCYVIYLCYLFIHSFIYLFIYLLIYLFIYCCVTNVCHVRYLIDEVPIYKNFYFLKIIWEVYKSVNTTLELFDLLLHSSENQNLQEVDGRNNTLTVAVNFTKGIGLFLCFCWHNVFMFPSFFSFFSFAASYEV